MTKSCLVMSAKSSSRESLKALRYTKPINNAGSYAIRKLDLPLKHGSICRLRVLSGSVFTASDCLVTNDWNCCFMVFRDSLTWSRSLSNSKEGIDRNLRKRAAGIDCNLDSLHHDCQQISPGPPAAPARFSQLHVAVSQECGDELS